MEARGQPQVPFLSSITLVFETEFFTDQKLIKYIRLTGQEASGICLTPPPQCMNYKYVLP